MPRPVLPRRARYLLGVTDGLRRLGGEAQEAELFSWMADSPWPGRNDAAAPSWFEEEVRSALAALHRAGLAEPHGRGGWGLTPPGRTVDLSPSLFHHLQRTVDGLGRGLLDPQRVYRAILDAARQGRFVSYGELGEAAGAPWSRARRPLAVLLGRLGVLARVRDWPMPSAIVVGKGEVATGRLVGAGRAGFLAAAAQAGLDPGSDPEAFIRDQQRRVFRWAPTAPERLDPTFAGTDYPLPLPAARPGRMTGTPPAAGPAPYTLDDVVAEGCFLPREKLEALLARLKARKNLILQGPPGSGKTWLAKRLAHALLGADDPETVRARLGVVQFHPSLAYEDFVRGWRPSADGLALTDGAFLRAVDAALADPDRPFVLVIEEINRGNPAQILGEMLTLLEDSKRRPDEGLELAYPRAPGERVHVPGNLYVIGTMNVADRSLALVDLALRRRFAFVSLDPALDEPWRRWGRAKGLSEGLIDRIKARLDALNAAIGEDRALGPQFRVGHSYVTPAYAVDDGEAWYRSVVETEIAPLLEEYWYDQPEKAEQARRALLADAP